MGALKNPKFVLPVMSHSGGTITATFQNGAGVSRVISSDVTLVATTLYMVYLVASGGTAALRISANVNSVGPAGFTTWTLVGAFYSNGTPAFGAFCNIIGPPATDYMTYVPAYNSIANGNLFVLGNGTNAGVYARAGQCFLYKNKLSFGSTTSLGGSSPIFNPIGARNNLVSEEAYELEGQLYDSSANTNWPMGAYDWSSNGLVLSWLQQNNVSFVSPTVPFTWTTNDHWRFSCRVPTVGLSNTQLVDL